jgi:hypothetical protein
MANKRAFIGAAFFALLLAGVFSPSVAQADPVTVASGDTSPSNQRRIANTSNGYWVFFAHNGDFSWSYSADGAAWTTPIAVFPSSPTAGDKGSIWWKNISGTDYVYAAVADGTTGDQDVFVRRGTLNSDGTITWAESARVSLYVTTNDVELEPGTPVVIALAADNDVWIAGEGKLCHMDGKKM